MSPAQDRNGAREEVLRALRLRAPLRIIGATSPIHHCRGVGDDSGGRMEKGSVGTRAAASASRRLGSARTRRELLSDSDQIDDSDAKPIGDRHYNVPGRLCLAALDVTEVIAVDAGLRRQRFDAQIANASLAPNRAAELFGIGRGHGSERASRCPRSMTTQYRRRFAAYTRQNVYGRGGAVVRQGVEERV